MPKITYSRNWKGPRPGVSTFEIDTTGDAEAIIIEDRLIRYLVSDKGPLEGLSNYKQQPKGPTYLEFLHLNKHFLNTIQYQFCNAIKDYTGDPFKLDLVTREVTIDQESMQAIVKGAFPGRGVAKPSVSVTNNEDILTFWVADALAAKKKAPPSKFFSFKKKKRSNNAEPGQDCNFGSELTSAAVLAQNVSVDEDDVVDTGDQDIGDAKLGSESNGTRSSDHPLFKAQSGVAEASRKVVKNMQASEDPKILSMLNVFGGLVEDKAQQHRLLLVSHPSARDKLLQEFSWVPEDPELTSESRSRSIPFDLLDINFRIICVLPEDFPRALAYPWPFRAMKFYDGTLPSTDPTPVYLPDLQRINFDSLDIEKGSLFFQGLVNGSLPTAISIIDSMREKFLQEKRILEASETTVQEEIDKLQNALKSPAPVKPSIQNFSQGNGISNGSTAAAAKASCEFDLSCRVMRCPGVCISNCEILEKDEEGFFYYQLPNSNERVRKCSNCTCSLSLHKIQPRAASLVNKPFSLSEVTDPSAESNKAKVEAQRRQKAAAEMARIEEAHRTRMNEWSAASQNRASEMAKMESDAKDLALKLQDLSSQLIVVKDCCARWDAALENWNDKNPVQKRS